MDSVRSIVSKHTHHIQNLSRLLRYATAVACWSSANLPTAARSSASVIVHVIVPVLLDLRFLFLLSNLIIVSLFLSRPSSTTAVESTAVVTSTTSSESTAVVREEESICVVRPPEKEKKTAILKKHVQGTLKRTRSLTTKAVVRIRIAAELLTAQTNFKIEKERDDKEFKDVVEAFIEKQRKFSEDENNLVYR